MVKILVLSFYYAPDLSAGSFRTTSLVKAILENTTDEVHIDVVSTLPNRYKTFSTEAPEYEEYERLKIHRVKLPPHHSGMLDQSRAFIQYFKTVNNIVINQKYDLVFATSSRLMTAVLGAWVATRKKARLYLDIRDIFVDTIKDILPGRITFFIKPIFSILENWTVNSADKVNLVSKGFAGYFESRYPKQKFSFFTNGIDEEFLNLENIQVDKPPTSGILKVLYAGNMGEGQGLHMIIPKLAQRMKNQLQFVLIGDGGRKKELQLSLSEFGCENVELREPVTRNELIKAYLEADVLFLHLNDYEAFYKVLPSKLFEYAALGKPIWAGVSGYAAEFIKCEIDNAVVFHPCNDVEASKVFFELALIDKKRTRFISKFSRVNIVNSMAQDILSVIH